jgi:glycosyltransferase involved in cell wall biosynthesis
MKILMLLEGEFPPDDRVEKEALSLMACGYQVSIACYTRKERPAFENYKGIQLYRMPISKLEYKLSAACLVLPVNFRIWRKFVSQLFNDQSFDVVHVHDLPLASVGYYFKKKYKLKLVCDQHEFYSNWIIHTAHYNTPLGKIVKALSDWKSYEKKYLALADLVITIEEPLRSSYLNEVGLPAEKVICLPNTPSGKIFENKVFDPNILACYQDRFVLFYAGNIDILRGLDVAIRALPLLKKEIPNVLLLMVGKIVKPYNPIELAEKLDVSEHLHFDGWSPIEKLPSYIQASDLCLFTPPANREEINRTIATKIYQYMQLDKPVIVGQAKMMKEFVEDKGIGYVINENSPEDFARIVLEYFKNKEAEDFRISTKCQGIKSEFVWEETVKRLISCYNIFSKS